MIREILVWIFAYVATTIVIFVTIPSTLLLLDCLNEPATKNPITTLAVAILFCIFAAYFYGALIYYQTKDW